MSVLHEHEAAIEAQLAEMRLLDPDEAEFYTRTWADLQVRKEQPGADYFTPVSNLKSELVRRLNRLRGRLSEAS